MSDAATASPDTVSQFLALKPEEQDTALKSLSPDAKSALLAGIHRGQIHNAPSLRAVPNALPPAPTPASPDNSSVFTGFGQRAVDAVRGAIHLFTPPSQEEAQKMTPTQAVLETILAY